VYFLGPEGTVLELIARQADREIAAGTGDAVRPLCLSEVGVGVPDVGEGVRALTRGLGVPAFPPQGTHFAPVGGSGLPRGRTGQALGQRRFVGATGLEPATCCV